MQLILEYREKMTTKYQGRFGKKAKKAVRDFVRRLSAQSNLVDTVIVARGPEEGGIMALAGVGRLGARAEMRLRSQMAKISSAILDKHSVWIVGVTTRWQA